MNKIIILCALLTGAVIFSGCGTTSGNASIIGKWKTEAGSVNYGKTSNQYFKSIYVFRDDKTVSVRTYGTNRDTHYTWAQNAKENSIAMKASNPDMTLTYTYVMPDKNSLLLIDSMNNTNRLERVVRQENSRNKTDNAGDKDSYVNDLKTKLNEWNADIVKMEHKADKFSGKVKLDYKKELSNLRRQSEEINKNLARIKRSADDSWEDFKDDVEDSGIKLQRAISNVQVRF